MGITAILLSLLTVFQSSSWEAMLEREVLWNQPVRSVLVTSDSVLWLGVQNRGLARVDRSTITWYTHADGLPSNGIADLHEHSDGTLWAAGMGGVSTRSDENWIPLEVTGELQPRVVFSLFEERGTGALWLATNVGAIRMNDGQFETHTNADGLPHQVVHAVVVDASGDRWFACRTGLARKSGEHLRVFYPGINFRSALGDPGGRLWFGTDDGVIMWDGSTWHRYLEGRTILPRLVAEDASPLAGSASSGLFRFQEGAWQNLPIPTRLEGAEIFDLSDAPDGAVWIATSRGIGVIRP